MTKTQLNGEKGSLGAFLHAVATQRLRFPVTFLISRSLIGSREVMQEDLLLCATRQRHANRPPLAHPHTMAPDGEEDQRTMHWSKRSTPGSGKSPSTGTGSSRCKIRGRSSVHG